MSHPFEFVSSLIGTNAARRAARLSRKKTRNPLAGLQEIISRVPPDDFPDSPIFILSAGWRSGSTLLQRLICSDSSTLIWGEPYDLCGIVQKFAQSLQPMSKDWPPADYLIDTTGAENLPERWIANLYPSPHALRDSFRAAILNLFYEPVKVAGAARWGLKEVRFGLPEAVFLHWLFPQAKFLLIHRPVEDAFRSYKHFSPSMQWYGRWPDQPAFTPFAFARHRQRLMNDFPAIVACTGGLMIDYENLSRGEVDLGAIEEYCALQIDARVVSDRIQGHGPTRLSSNNKNLNWLDRRLLQAGTALEIRKVK